MTKREAAIVTAYTGYLVGDFQGFHEYAEEIFGRPVWTHEFGSREVAQKLQDKSKADFCAIKVTE